MTLEATYYLNFNFTKVRTNAIMMMRRKHDYNHIDSNQDLIFNVFQYHLLTPETALQQEPKPHAYESG